MERRKSQQAAERHAKQEDRGQITSSLDVEPATVREKCSRRVNIVAVRGSYCVHRVRVGPQRRVEGCYTNLSIVVQRQTAMDRGERVDREGRAGISRVVAASSEMRGEKYRDEVGLGQSEGNDRPTTSWQGPVPLKEAQLDVVVKPSRSPV